jgi:NAD(P)-dependent dehydrogenase (short-subunit alcohol dehydrogenase family)
VAVVTGVAHERGIGRAISLRYAEEGARRAICRDELPEDLAGPAFFLASEDSDFMTCQSIVVEGGGSMW